MAAVNYMTFSEAAAEIGCETWHVRRVHERGLMPTPAKVGVCRVVARRDLPKLRRALEQAGYLKAEPVPA
jgi:hypothetical protein